MQSSTRSSEVVCSGVPLTHSFSLTRLHSHLLFSIHVIRRTSCSPFLLLSVSLLLLFLLPSLSCPVCSLSHSFLSSLTSSMSIILCSLMPRVSHSHSPITYPSLPLTLPCRDPPTRDIFTCRSLTPSSLLMKLPKLFRRCISPPLNNSGASDQLREPNPVTRGTRAVHKGRTQTRHE